MKRAIELGDGDFLAGVHLSVEDARNREAAKIVAVVKVRYQDLQRTRWVALGRRNRLDNRVEQRAQVLTSALNVGGRCPNLGVGVEYRKIDLLFFRVQVDK